ncbi:MAG TPA: co-chaperone GroES [Candidatus Dependentiae bacterium]|nr:co-chaperone GroES [Candidatus Dependentiae bacterium]HRQ63211.1 co-chaperone GroES [Candidatus Dependentiae bacterium]
MFQKLRPLGDRVLVKCIEDQEKTAGGIIIPDAAKEKAQTGAVVSVGTGRKDEHGNPIAMEVKVGDIVYFGKYAGTQAGDNHLIIREDEILGIVEK